MSLPTAEILDRFDIAETIFDDGATQLYRATLKATGQVGALRVLPSAQSDDAAECKRLERELRRQQSIDSPFLAKPLAFDTLGGRYCVFRRWVDGQPLARRIANADPLGSDTLLALAHDLGEALDSIHRVGLLHRSLRPSVVIEEHKGPFVLVEPGMAFTSAGVAPVDFRYLAPEVADGQPATPRSDLYALGRILLEASGAPFAAPSSSTSNDPPSLPDALPTALSDLLRQLLHREPSGRPFSARRVIRTVDGMRDPDGATKPPPKAPDELLASVLAEFDEEPTQQSEIRPSIPGMLRRGSLPESSMPPTQLAESPWFSGDTRYFPPRRRWMTVSLSVVLGGLAVGALWWAWPSGRSPAPVLSATTPVIDASATMQRTSPTADASVSDNPDDAAKHEFVAAREEARLAYREGRYRDAERAYQKAVGFEPQQAGMYAGLGATHLQLRQPDLAVTAYKQALRIDPDNANYWVALGHAYRATGDRVRARRSYQRALKLAPDNPHALESLGRKISKTQ